MHMSMKINRLKREKTEYRDKKGTVIRDEDTILWESQIYEVYKDPFIADWVLDNVLGAPISLKEVHNQVSVVVVKEIPGLSESIEKEAMKHQKLLTLRLATMESEERILLIMFYEQYVQIAISEGLTPKSMLDFIDEDLESMAEDVLNGLEKGLNN
ncbi:hypothetical protein N374_gp166 [Bacillus phage phiNIT1]|uniref:Uncharacterized protein n=1 Tax=Bacillus phage phiNIT1 TaxID=207656 RepID=S6ATU2_9CAUD|nr:hypothetical protein N374_gp166 [Bacillus phage phiNIT1]BAN59651.1 hypothetical protein [Bacillus phage phiNIT1]